MPDGPVRNQAVDFYRVSGVVLIVLGHWLAGAVTYSDGSFGRQNPLVDQPWTQWLTWIFQAVPTFFVVAGYAAAVSWTHRRTNDELSRQAWVRRRLARVLGPTTVYVALVSVVVVALDFSDVASSTLEYAGWAVAMHLWFLAVYLAVALLTPIAIAAQRRWGLLVPTGLAIAVAAVDAARYAGQVPYVGWLNYLFCWAALYQLGIAWQKGLLAGARSVVLAVGSAAALLALLLWLGPYPVSMIGVPGQAMQNTEPPSLAMLAFGCAQAGLVISLAPTLNRALRGRAVQRLLARANSNVMGLYLWHMIPVVIVAIVGYPVGLLPQPVEGSAEWWLVRLEWVVVLSLVTAVELALLWWGRSIFAAPLPSLTAFRGRWAEPITLAGAALAASGLAYLAAAGFAAYGSFAWPAAATFAVGVLLVAIAPSRVSPTR